LQQFMAAGITATAPSEAKDWAELAGRAGLVARGVVYLMVAVLAAQVATGNRGGERADQRGALTELADKPFGTASLVILSIGFGCYALWRVFRAVVGEELEEPKLHQRLGDLGKAALYLALLGSSLALLQGGDATDPGQTWSARLMTREWGRWVVGAVGAAIALSGAWFVRRGLTERFRKHLERQRGWAVQLGVIGHVARGLAFALIGLFVVRAAVRFDPSAPVGLDAALRELAARPAGPALLLATAAGLAAFGLYSLAEAKDRRVMS